MVRVVVRNLLGMTLPAWAIGRSGYLALDMTFFRAVPEAPEE
jgi:hypothetical protein